MPRSKLLAAALGVLLLIPLAGTATADTRPVDPSNPATPVTVSADALPTVQINGVVWQQAVIGNTVYAVGSFSRARPAGAAAGTQEVPRANVLAYDLTTGALKTDFVADTNQQVRTVTASPDQKRLYLGGDFTSVNGRQRNYLAAVDPATGAVLDDFVPNPNHYVRAVVATDTTVYLGGDFSTVAGHPRNRLGAVTTTGGFLSAFQPVIDDGYVAALTLNHDRTKLVVGGSFTAINRQNGAGWGYGLGMVDAATGLGLFFAANNVVRDATTNAAILALTSDATNVYGSGYVYGGPGGNLEGSFSANWSDTKIRWLEDCHGDTYGISPSDTAVYVAGHPHTCLNIGAFGETTPRTFHRALAFSPAATGTVGPNLGGSTYYNFEGQPDPSLLNWFPDINAGTYTGQNQGPWTVTATSNYVLYGGEFTTVNAKPQQGLVRFAVSTLAPNRQGPRATGSDFQPTISQPGPGSVTVSWPANWDRDNTNLTYTLYQDKVAVSTVNAESVFYSRPTLSATVTAVSPGSHSYAVKVGDPFQNTVWSPTVTATVS